VFLCICFVIALKKYVNIIVKVAIDGCQTFSSHSATIMLLVRKWKYDMIPPSGGLPGYAARSARESQYAGDVPKREV
jgi:hypothetical protein